jgi:hypothetical protein
MAGMFLAALVDHKAILGILSDEHFRSTARRLRRGADDEFAGKKGSERSA